MRGVLALPSALTVSEEVRDQVSREVEAVCSLLGGLMGEGE